MTAELAIVTASHRGDGPTLSRTVPLWASLEGVAAIVVVAWDGEWARDLVALSPRVTVVEAGEGEAFRPGLARNLGVAALPDAEAVLALDPDAAPRDLGGARARLGTTGGSFVAGGMPARSRGQVLFRPRSSARVGGFHEYLVGRGIEGEDFARRLEAGGLARRLFGRDALSFPAGTRDPVLPDACAPPVAVPMPPGLWRSPGFVARRNRLLAALVPWDPVFASLRPRRLGGGAGDRIRRAVLAPSPPIGERLLDCASFLAARFGGDDGAEALDADTFLRPLLAASAAEGGDEAQLLRETQIETARALLGIAGPWR